MLFKKALVACIGILGTVGLSFAALPNEGAVVFSAANTLALAGPSKVIFIKNGKADPVKNLCSQNGMNYRISPDGDFVAFDDKGKGKSNPSVYICELKENAVAVKVADGACPFWVGSGQNKKLFWSTLGSPDKVFFGAGKSYLQPIDLNTKKFTAGTTAQEQKFNKKSAAMKGGLDKNGVYACTGYEDAYIATAEAGANCGVATIQRCNPSISPTSGKAMFLDTDAHISFGIYNNTGKVVTIIQFRDYQVQNPEWSTHEDWMSWVSGNHEGKDVYIGKIPTGSKADYYKGDLLYTGVATFPHLYVGALPTTSAIFRLNHSKFSLPQNLFGNKQIGKKGSMSFPVLLGKKNI